MTKRIIALVLLVVLALTLFAACEKKKGVMLTPEEAQKVALKDMGISAKKASDIHTHTIMEGNTPCYNIHITYNGVEYEYLINAKTGDIIKKAP